MAKRKFTFAAGVEEEPKNSEVENKPKDVKEKSVVQELVEKIDTPANTAFNFKFVKRSKMVFHESNDYPMESVEELADSILNYGLIHNIEVFYDIEKDQYIIDSGEQRTRAIDCLIEKYQNYEDTESDEYQKYLKNVKQFEQGYPCNVKTQSHNESLNEKESEVLDQIDTEIRLIIANELGRGKDTVRTKKHIDRLNELYSKRNATLKRTEKINVNKEIAKQLNITDKQVKIYKDINKLIPELRAKFEENQISLNDGANYSKLSEDEQRQILTLIENGENKKEITRLMEQMKSMSADISTKEQHISDLEDTVKEQQELISKIREEQNTLQEQLKTEQQKESPDKSKVKELEESLKESNKKISEQKKALDKNLKEKDHIIEDLQKKLAAKDNLSSMNNNAKAIRSQFEVEKGICDLEKAFENLRSALNVYETTIIECGVESEDFSGKIMKIIKENENFYK